MVLCLGFTYSLSRLFFQSFFTLIVPLRYLGNEWVFFSILHVSGTPLVLGGGGGAFFKAAAFLYVCDIGRIEESGLV